MTNRAALAGPRRRESSSKNRRDSDLNNWSGPTRPQRLGADDETSTIEPRHRRRAVATQNVPPQPSSRPVGKPIVNRLPRAEPLREVAPRHAGLESINHRVEKQSVAAPRLRPGPLRRKQSSTNVPTEASLSACLCIVSFDHALPRRTSSAAEARHRRQSLRELGTAPKRLVVPIPTPTDRRTTDET